MRLINSPSEQNHYMMPHKIKHAHINRARHRNPFTNKHPIRYKASQLSTPFLSHSPSFLSNATQPICPQLSPPVPLFFSIPHGPLISTFLPPSLPFSFQCNEVHDVANFLHFLSCVNYRHNVRAKQRVHDRKIQSFKVRLGRSTK